MALRDICMHGGGAHHTFPLLCYGIGLMNQVLYVWCILPLETPMVALKGFLNHNRLNNTIFPFSTQNMVKVTC